MSITETQKKTLSARLKEIRLMSGMKQCEIASEFYISRSCWSNYERGKRMPTIETINKIANHFGLDIDCLIGETEVSEDAKSIIKRQREIFASLTEEGNLNLSLLPLADKISLIDYYKFLLWKHNNKT